MQVEDFQQFQFVTSSSKKEKKEQPKTAAMPEESKEQEINLPKKKPKKKKKKKAEVVKTDRKPAGDETGEVDMDLVTLQLLANCLDLVSYS